MTSAAPSAQGPGISIRGVLRFLLSRREYGVAILLALTITLVAIVNPAFVSPGNIRDVLVAAAPFAIIGCGLTFVIVTGEIDISVGSLAGLLAAVLGLLSSRDHANMPVPAAIAITLALGTAVGLLNGFLVAYARVPSIIVTLGMLTALRYPTEKLMHGEWIKNLPPTLRFFGTGTVFSIPISLWTAACAFAAAAILATYTPIGRRIYAVGSSPHAARLAGLSPRRIKLFTFALTGALVGVATLVSVPQLAVIESGFGSGWELLVVTAVVVGGTSISGGRGTIAGTVLAVVLLGIVRTVLIFLRLGDQATYWERAIQGGFILLAVLMDHLNRTRTHAEDHP